MQASLQRSLLISIGSCVLVFVVIHTVLVHRQTLQAVNVAYDRTLLASAKTIGESLVLQGDDVHAKVVALVPYSALEAFEADSRSRMTYRVTGLNGELVSGYADLNLSEIVPVESGPYAALVDFFDAKSEGKDVRVAVLKKPVANATARGMAQVQVVETMELRLSLAQKVLTNTLLVHGALLAMVLLVVWRIIRQATSGIRRIGEQIEARDPLDLESIRMDNAPEELRPVLDATNRMMMRLQDAGEEQKRFVRDASHQLRTPLAVLKVQAQSALRGDVPPLQGLQEINLSIDRATNVANQMLALAKVEQLRLASQVGKVPTFAIDAIVRDLALELAPLMGHKQIEFEIATQYAPVRAHEWMLRELCRNLLANAIRFNPEGGMLVVQVINDREHAVMSISDQGPGLTREARRQLFKPFGGSGYDASGYGASGFGASGSSEASTAPASDEASQAITAHAGTGLGLVICKDICDALSASLSFDQAHPHGLIVTVQFDLSSWPVSSS